MRARATERSRWWTTFVLAALMSVLWLLATPIFAAPDEPAHAIRAASAARLQILGEESARYDDQLVVDAPRAYLGMGGRIGCYAFARDVPAACAQFPGNTDLEEVPTSAGRHPPAYYVVAGIPSLAFRGELGIYLIRLVSVLLTAAFLASAVSTLERLRRPRVGALGILLAATPMLFFVGAVVNPSAAEIPAALCCWTAGVALAIEAPTGVDPRLVRRVAVSAIVLALSRQLAPLWLGLIAVSLVIIAGTACIRALWESRSARRWGAAAIAATIAQVAWIAIVRPLDATLSDEHAIPNLDTLSAIRTSFGESLGRFREMVGWFGWLDTPSPGLTYACWTIALVLLLAVALVAGRRRFVLVAAGVAVATVALPVFFETLEASTTGFFWQGRYTMPLAVGVPLLLALSVAVDRADGAPTRDVGAWLRRGNIVGVIAVLVAVGHVAAFWQALRRNAVGYEGSLGFVVDPTWAPPVPAWLLVLGNAVVVVAFVAWVVDARPGSTGTAQPEPTPSGSLRYS